MYLGDFAVGAAIDVKFSTSSNFAGGPFSLAGGAIRCYKANGTVECATAPVLAVDFDAMTGLHHVRVDTSLDPAFYVAGSDFSIVVGAGTVDGVSIAGLPIAHFSLAARSAAPTAASVAAAVWAYVTRTITSSASVTVVSPVTQAGDITIVRRDDYSTADSQQLSWTITGAPSLVDATVTMYIQKPNASVYAKALAGVAVSATVATVDIVGSTDTAALEYGTAVYEYQLRAVLASGRRKTLATGSVNVVRDLTVAP